MTSQVYYRKWRPQRFSELVGQEHVSTTLRQAVKQSRIAHSYLYCGPRGTGKTSTARVLAKAVNCLGPQDGDPCNGCARCQAVNEGRFMDLIELDAASNRGIDEIRNIRERVNLSPAEGGYKVYIIDEAHMLTEHASNAFLKTLEEPPPHAIFILCTTEPHKILPTIISRCQRFDFRRLTSETIIERLQMICLEEGVTVDREALVALAHSAGGSLRDAENSLEQLVVSFGDRIGIQEVYDILGLGQGEMALEFTRYLVMGNASAALAAINRAAWDGVDLRQLHRRAVDLLRGLLMLRYGSGDSLDLPQEVVKELEDLASKTSTARVVKSLKLLGEVNMKYDTSSTLPLELAVVEVSMEEAPEIVPTSPGPSPRPSSSPHTTAEKTPAESHNDPTTNYPLPSEEKAGNEGSEEAERMSISSTQSPIPVTVPEVRSPPPQESSKREDVEVLSSPELGSEGSKGSIDDQWSGLIRTLSRYKGKRFNIGALLRDCKSQHIEGEALVLMFAHRSHLERMQEELDDPQGAKMVKEALVKSLGVAYELRLSLVDNNTSGGVPSTGQSPLVRTALSMGAKIIEERDQ